MKASDIVSAAVAELGVTESPAGSNNVKYNAWYYKKEVSGNYPWCMAFVQWLFREGGIKPPSRTASCGTLMKAAQKKGQWVTADYKPGDILIYDFPGGAKTDHCGVCESFDGKTVTAIEGNTSVTNASNGGEVRRMKRKVNLVVGAWRPTYEEEEEVTYEKFKEFMDQYIEELASLPDEDWGTEWREAKSWAEKETHLIKGDENGNKQYKSMPTRQQLILFLYRFKNVI